MKKKKHKCIVEGMLWFWILKLIKIKSGVLVLRSNLIALCHYSPWLVVVITEMSWHARCVI